MNEAIKQELEKRKYYEENQARKQMHKQIEMSEINEVSLEYPKLSDGAMYGLAGEVVRIIEPHTEADNVALLIQLLAGFGNLINKTAYFRAGADHHYSKIFAVLVGATASGRKGSSWSEIKRVLIRVDESFQDCIQNGLSSGEGLIYFVRDAQFKKTPIREKQRIVDYQDEMIDEGTKEKRAFIVEPEFARVLKVSQREGNTLSSVIREAWDSDRLRVMTKNAIKASNAHIGIVGHITKDELKQTLAETDTTNGFANRFLWLCVKRSKYLPDGGNLEDWELNESVRCLREAVEFAKTAWEIKRDDRASEFWREIYQPLSDGQAGLVGSITSRATAQTLRLAMLYALLDCSNMIRLEHLKAGLALWRYCEDSAKYIFGLSLGNKLADEIFDALQTAKDGMTRSDLSHHFQRNRTSAEIKNALELLLEVGRIESFKEKTSKRPREIFRVMGYEKNEFNEFNQEIATDKALNSLNSLNSLPLQENNSDSETEYF
jgi:predicted transcriptional regulator